VLYEGALSGGLLSGAAKALDSGHREALGELAEALLGASEPLYTGTKATQAVRVIQLEINHLVGLGISTDDVSALIVASETRGARSRTNQAGVELVPPALLRLFEQIDPTDTTTPPAADPAADPARYTIVRSLR
jgi:hypothetical protein